MLCEQKSDLTAVKTQHTDVQTARAMSEEDCDQHTVKNKVETWTTEAAVINQSNLFC